MSRTRVDEMQQAPAASPAPPNYDLRRMSSSFIKEPAHPALEDLDPATSFLYKPHTIWALLLGVVALVYFSGAFAPQQPATPEAAYTNAKAGIAAVCGVFLVYSLLQRPPSLREQKAAAMVAAAQGASSAAGSSTSLGMTAAW